MQKSPIFYYYKDPETGVEMHFSKSSQWGWSIGFPNITFEHAFDYKGVIPWPKLPAEEQAVVDERFTKEEMKAFTALRKLTLKRLEHEIGDKFEIEVVG